MARVPRIDTPCPLDAASQEALNGQCDVCQRQVHRLDGLDEAQRRALLASADGAVCVSYRVPAAARAPRGMGRVIAATLIGAGLAGAAHAGTPPADTATEPPALGVPVASPLAPPVAPAMSPAASDDLLDVSASDDFGLIFVGGVSTPGEAEWVEVDDDSDVPELPVVVRPVEVR